MPDETTGLVSSKKSMSKHTYIHTEKKDQNRSNRRHFGGKWRNPNRDCTQQKDTNVKFLGCDNTV